MVDTVLKSSLTINRVCITFIEMTTFTMKKLCFIVCFILAKYYQFQVMDKIFINDSIQINEKYR